MFLTVIKPPNNAVTALMKLKRGLYCSSGIVSAWALPPIIPVATFSEMHRMPEKKDLPPLPGAGIPLIEVFENGGQLFLGSEVCSGFCRQVGKLFDGCAGFEPGFGGLHILDCSESGDIGADDLKMQITDFFESAEASVRNLKSCSLEICRTDVGLFKDDLWWKRIEFEILAEISFPKLSRQ